MKIFIDRFETLAKGLVWLTAVLVLSLAAPGMAQHEHSNVHTHEMKVPQWEGSVAGLAYSQFNHHLAGVFILLIGLSELRTAFAYQALAWTRFLLPLSLLSVGAYLLAWSDHDAWPIGALSFTQTFFGGDFEIMQHKLFAVLSLAMGTAETFRRLGKAVNPGWVLPLPLFAIIGGLLLFSHQHGDHPGAHSIAVNHMIIGFTAIAAGTCKLLSFRPPLAMTRSVATLRFCRFAWPVLIMVIGLQLLIYTE